MSPSNNKLLSIQNVNKVSFASFFSFAILKRVYNWWDEIKEKRCVLIEWKLKIWKSQVKNANKDLE